MFNQMINAKLRQTRRDCRFVVVNLLGYGKSFMHASLRKPSAYQTVRRPDVGYPSVRMSAREFYM